MSRPAIRILGIDPGLRRTGWGLIESDGNRLIHIACGSVETSERAALGERLVMIHDGLIAVIEKYAPQEAAVEHTFGSGKTLLIGTFPGGGYFRNHTPATREFFASLPTWAGVQPQLQTSDLETKARLHTGPGGTYVWVVNPTRTPKTVKIALPSAFQKATELWQETNHPNVADKTLTTGIEDRNAAVIRLE